MAKYESMDDRTGYQIGEIVELSLDELNNVPFNVCLRMVESVDEAAKIAAAEEDVEKKAFFNELVNEVGLSRLRSEKIMKVFSTKQSLLSSLDKLPFSELENDTLIKYYGSVKKSRKVR